MVSLCVLLRQPYSESKHIITRAVIGQRSITETKFYIMPTETSSFASLGKHVGKLCETDANA